MAYDAAHHQVVLFGGETVYEHLFQYANDTWAWDGTNWTQLAVSNTPPARSLAAMAYDGGHSDVVMFGGVYEVLGGYTVAQSLRDTWVLNGLNWTQQSPQAASSAGEGCSMTYDAASGQVVLFGGENESGGNRIPNAETWVWDGMNWTKKSPPNAPSARYQHAAAFDAAHSQIVLFGGADTKRANSETWIWDGANWTQESPQASPSARLSHSMAYDTQHGQVVLFGGEDAGGNLFGDTWTWVGSSVTLPTITSVISASGYGGAAAVSPGDWVEIYGSNLASATHEWAGTDFSGNNAPTALGGVQVTIGGQNAFIEYISSSPPQINAQLPSNIPSGGTVPVIVTNGAASSQPFNLTVNPTQPGLLAPASFQIGGKQYLAALFSDGVTYVLPPGAISGVASRQAHTGETITTYGIGFGSVTPDTPAGEIAPQSTQLALPLQVLFGQTPAQVSYAGLAPGFVGLYQFDLLVPAVPNSDLVPVTFNLGGVSGTQTLYTAVQQ
ncbi:MAG TPA: kelch repeat-containing protein [Bryobacteraceae bacterium]|nr:kelch repeat-containing protein [Bryobacteraceae bacterium]